MVLQIPHGPARKSTPPYLWLPILSASLTSGAVEKERRQAQGRCEVAEEEATGKLSSREARGAEETLVGTFSCSIILSLNSHQ